MGNQDHEIAVIVKLIGSWHLGHVMQRERGRMFVIPPMMSPHLSYLLERCQTLSGLAFL